MKEQNYYRKISKIAKVNQNKDKNNNLKYLSLLRSLNNKVSDNLKYIDSENLDNISNKKINYSECNEYLQGSHNFGLSHKKQNNLNIPLIDNCTYYLNTINDENKKNYSHKRDKKSNYFQYLTNNTQNDMKNEKEVEEYDKKYSEKIDNKESGKDKREYSFKLQKNRENLNNIVKSLNEFNNSKLKEKLNNEKNKLKENYSNDKIKENKSSCFNNYNSVNFKLPTFEDISPKKRNVNLFINNIKSHKYLTESHKNCIDLKDGKKNKFESHTYENKSPKTNITYKSNDYKVNIPSLRKFNPKLNIKQNYHKNLTTDHLLSYSNNSHNELSQDEDNVSKLNNLRSEFETISNNYLKVSKQIDSIKSKKRNNSETSYENIINNNIKSKDILDYDYKYKNDVENEKVFILMKLNIKNNEIIISKLEDENKIYKRKLKKLNNVVKQNNVFIKENISLKEDLNQMNINYQKINEEIEEYIKKFSNIDSFNKKIQEINRGLINENLELKRNYENTKEEYDELKNNYKKIIPQQKELIKKLEEDKKNSIKKLENEMNEISEDNKKLKLQIDDNQLKYKNLEEINSELNDKNIKLESNIKDINNKYMELQKINDTL